VEKIISISMLKSVTVKDLKGWLKTVNNQQTHKIAPINKILFCYVKEKETIQERANLKKPIQLPLLPSENFPICLFRTGIV